MNLERIAGNRLSTDIKLTLGNDHKLTSSDSDTWIWMESKGKSGFSALSLGIRGLSMQNSPRYNILDHTPFLEAE